MEQQFKEWFETIKKCVVEPINPEALQNGAIFGFKFPEKFSQKDLFLKGDTSATARAYFFPENMAKVITKDYETEVSWLIAYNYIASGSFGSKVVPHPVGISQTLPSESALNRRLNLWAERLNSIPFVVAGVVDHDAHSIGKGALISFRFPATIKEMISITRGAEWEGIGGYLMYNGHAIWTGAEKSELFFKNYYANHFTSFGEVTDALQHFIATMVSSLPGPDIATQKLDFSADEVGLRILRFKTIIIERFQTLGVTITNNIGEHPGQLFSVNFPGSLSDIEKKETSRSIDFYDDGNAMFCEGDEVTWNKALDILDDALTKIANLVPA